MGSTVAPAFLPVHRYAEPKPNRQVCLSHKIAAALIGLSTPLQLQWFGILYASEILLAVVAVWALATHLADGYFWCPPIIKLVGFLGVTMLAYIVTDLILGTESQDLLRGWARNLFL